MGLSIVIRLYTYEGKQEFVIVFLGEPGRAEQEGHDDGTLSDGKQVGL